VFAIIIPAAEQAGIGEAMSIMETARQKWEKRRWRPGRTRKKCKKRTEREERTGHRLDNIVHNHIVVSDRTCSSSLREHLDAHAHPPPGACAKKKMNN